MRACGIYAIENIISGRVYVGSSTNVKRRWSEHQSLLQNSKHHSIRLQRSWAKHGASAFVFRLLESAPLERLTEREQHWMTELSAADLKLGFNVLPNAGTPKGRTFSPETIAKMSASQRGRVLSVETRAKIGAKSIGRTLTDAQKAVISKRHAGKVLSPDTIAKLTGRKLPPLSDAHKASIRKHHLGNPRSPEVRMRISQSLMGRKHGPMSDSHKARISAAQKARRAQ